MCDVKYEQVVTSARVKQEVVAFSERDLTIPYRLVGSYEYARSLRRFDQLLELSTPEQIEVYDRLLAKEPQFSFYAGMHLQPDLANSFNTSIPIEKSQFDEHFLRSGVNWMMALAKIELGSTVSTYGDQSIKQPFSVFRPNRFDGEACFLILADDLQAHVKNLEEDKDFALAIASRLKVDNWTFAYLRRARLMHDMARALLTSGNREVVSRLRRLERDLDDRAVLLEGMIDSARRSQTTVSDGNVDRSKGNRKFLIGPNQDCNDTLDTDNLTGTAQDRR